MGADYLFDTSIVISLLRNDGRTVMRLESDDRVFLSPVVLGELQAGALKSNRALANLREVEALLARYRVVAVDVGTARRYATIHHRLRTKGRPIPDHDIWIAATALQHDLILVTRDAHFADVDGLRVEQV